MSPFEKAAPGEHSHLEEAVENRVENLVFNYRAAWLLLITLGSLFLGYHALQIKPETGFQKMIPQDHEYIENFNKHKEYVASPNMVRIIVEARSGTIFDAGYLQTLQELNDAVFFLPGVDRAALKFWQIFSTLKMAAIILTGGNRFVTGGTKKNTLALLPQLMPKIHKDIIELLEF